MNLCEECCQEPQELCCINCEERICHTCDFILHKGGNRIYHKRERITKNDQEVIIEQKQCELKEEIIIDLNDELVYKRELTQPVKQQKNDEIKEQQVSNPEDVSLKREGLRSKGKKIKVKEAKRVRPRVSDATSSTTLQSSETTKIEPSFEPENEYTPSVNQQKNSPTNHRTRLEAGKTSKKKSEDLTIETSTQKAIRRQFTKELLQHGSSLDKQLFQQEHLIGGQYSKLMYNRVQSRINQEKKNKGCFRKQRFQRITKSFSDQISIDKCYLQKVEGLMLKIMVTLDQRFKEIQTLFDDHQLLTLIKVVSEHLKARYNINISSGWDGIGEAWSVWTQDKEVRIQKQYPDHNQKKRLMELAFQSQHDLIERLKTPQIWKECADEIPIGLNEDFQYLVLKFKAFFRLNLDRERKQRRISMMMEGMDVLAGDFVTITTMNRNYLVKNEKIELDQDLKLILMMRKNLHNREYFRICWDEEPLSHSDLNIDIYYRKDVRDDCCTMWESEKEFSQWGNGKFVRQQILNREPREVGFQMNKPNLLPKISLLRAFQQMHVAVGTFDLSLATEFCSQFESGQGPSMEFTFGMVPQVSVDAMKTQIKLHCRLKVKIHKLEEKIEKMKNCFNEDFDQEFSLRKQFNFWGRDYQFQPHFARTDMFDYKANDNHILDVMLTPLDQSYGFRTDHHAFLDSRIQLQLEQTDELKETGPGCQKVYVTEETWVDKSSNGLAHLHACQNNFNFERAVLNKEMVTESTLLTLEFTFKKYPLVRTHVTGYHHRDKDGKIAEYNNLIPFELEYRLYFLLTNLLLQELFVLCAPDQLKIDIERLIATGAVFTSVFCGCGNMVTSKQDFRKWLRDDSRFQIDHPWLAPCYNAFRIAMNGQFGFQGSDLNYCKSKLVCNIEFYFNVAWENHVLPVFKQDEKRRERFKMMWKYQLCMYTWESKYHDWKRQQEARQGYCWNSAHENRQLFQI